MVDFSANLFFNLHFFFKKKMCGHLIMTFGENLYNVSSISVADESLHFCKSTLKKTESKAKSLSCLSNLLCNPRGF